MAVTNAFLPADFFRLHHGTTIAMPASNPTFQPFCYSHISRGSPVEDGEVDRVDGHTHPHAGHEVRQAPHGRFRLREEHEIPRHEGAQVPAHKVSRVRSQRRRGGGFRHSPFRGNLLVAVLVIGIIPGGGVGVPPKRICDDGRCVCVCVTGDGATHTVMLSGGSNVEGSAKAVASRVCITVRPLGGVLLGGCINAAGLKRFDGGGKARGVFGYRTIKKLAHEHQIENYAIFKRHRHAE